MESILRSFLKLYWLRPENGLICTFKSNVFRDVEFASPSLDISCGDGLFMFLHLGGEFEDEVDYFLKTDASKFSHDAFIDIYNHYDNEYQVAVKNPPGIKIDFGTDWKKQLVDKASVLNIYKRLLVHDNHQIPFPFEDDYFQTIYSNSIYWTSNSYYIAKDIHRMLKPGGTAVLEVKTPFLFETLEQLEGVLDKDAIDILDRQRRKTMPGGMRHEEWTKSFEEIGYSNIEARNVYPNKVLIDIWNIGLRPISHLLIQMSDNLSKEDRARIKGEWVTIFYELFKPLLKLDPNYEIEKAPYLCFILTK